MDRTWLLIIVLAGGVALLGLMALGWRARQRRQSSIAAPDRPPVVRGTELGVFAGRYIATTLAGQPLERVSVHGLGFRSAGRFTVYADGILLERAGEPDLWIPRARMSATGRATWTIDRVVESDGLTVIAWDLGGTEVETALRLDEPARFDEALDALTLSSPSSTGDLGSTERTPS